MESRFSYASQYGLNLTLTEQSTSISGNYSVIYYKYWIHKYSGTGLYSGYNNTRKLILNNQYIINGTYKGYDFRGITDLVLAEGTMTVYHNSDGTYTMPYYALFSALTNSYELGQAEISGSMGLTTIPRASSVTATDGNIESSISININRASSSFKHTLKYSFGSLLGTIATDVDTSYGWNIPSSFYSQIPNSLSGTITITCQTYNGSSLIGTSSTTCKALVNKETNAPDVTAVIEDVNPLTLGLTGNKNTMVKFCSNAKVTISSTPKNESTIKSTKVVCADGKSYDGDTTLIGVESGKFNVYATDSRGIVGDKLYEKTLINYVKLTLDVELYRPESTTGEVVIKYSGNYFNGSFGNVTNTLGLKYRYKIADAEDSTYSNWISITPVISNNTYSNGDTPLSLGTQFDYEEAYFFQIVATDKIKSVQASEEKSKVAQGIPIFDWGEHDFSVNKTIYIDGAMYLKDSNGTYVKIIWPD